MNSTIQKAFDELERQRLQIVKRIENLPESVYTRPRGRKWSMAQVVTHLIISEKLSLAYMKKKSLGMETLENSGFRQAFLSVLLKISQRGPFRFHAPKVIIENTPDAFPLEEAIMRWEESREEMSQFLNTINDRHARKLIYKHPVAGMLNAEQALKFMFEHVNHHLPQMRFLLTR